MLQHGSTDCRVFIIAPNGTVFGMGSAAKGHAPLEAGLLAAETHKDLAQAVGSFQLTLDGIEDAHGRRWEDRIPMRSLVFIAMVRDAAPGLPDVDPTVMVGLTDHHAVQDTWSEAHQRRTVSISGRELSCIILDATLIYHPALAARASVGLVTIENIAQGVLSLALSANPAQMSRGRPMDILRVILDMFIFHGGSGKVPAASESKTPVLQQPVISVDMPGIQLDKLLVPQYDLWHMFDNVTVDIGQFPAQVNSVWNYLHLWIDRNFQEFFTRVEDGVVKIHFRAKPFKQDYVKAGTRFVPSEETVGTLHTIRLDPADLVAQSRERDSSNVYNFFSVLPRGLRDDEDVYAFRQGVLPAIIQEADHPSFIGKYGIRVMEVQSPYLSQLAPMSPKGSAGAVTPQSLVPQPSGAAIWAPKANQYATQIGLIPAHRPWFVAMIHKESSFNTTPALTNKLEKNGSYSQGIAQFNTQGAPTNVGLVDPFDPDNALQAAARYWQNLRAQFGDDPRIIVAAYNAGPGAVIAAHGIPDASAAHVAAVEALVPRYAEYEGKATTAAQDAKNADQPPPPAPPLTTTAGQVAVPASALDLMGTSQRWASILRAWYEMGAELFGGQLVVRGHAAWNVGHRLLARDERGEWEGYIEGVSHRYDIRTGQFLTTMRYTRGWYLSAAIAQQIWDEGHTTVVKTTGGPPKLNPTTGTPEPPPSPVPSGPAPGVVNWELFFKKFPEELPAPTPPWLFRDKYMR